MATTVASVPISGRSLPKMSDVSSLKPSRLSRSKSYSLAMVPRVPKRNFSVYARYSDGGRHDSSEFLAGFLLGGAIFGTLAYIYAPQVRRFVQNENEHGFARARPPLYYDDGGLETTRNTLHEKIAQLNNAIDKVSSRLRGGGNKKIEVDELDGVC